jgi:hypothetical protein
LQRGLTSEIYLVMHGGSIMIRHPTPETPGLDGPLNCRSEGSGL